MPSPEEFSKLSHNMRDMILTPWASCAFAVIEIIPYLGEEIVKKGLECGCDHLGK